MDILKLVNAALATLGIIVVYGWYDENLATHITFLEFDNLQSDYSDDEAETEEHYIQVDIWTKDVAESQTLKKHVKTLMKNAGFFYEDGADLVETKEDGTQLWHIAQRFLIIENL